MLEYKFVRKGNTTTHEHLQTMTQYQQFTRIGVNLHNNNLAYFACYSTSHTRARRNLQQISHRWSSKTRQSGRGAGTCWISEDQAMRSYQICRVYRHVRVKYVAHRALLSLYAPSKLPRSTSANRLTVPQTKLPFSARSFRVSAPTAWNSNATHDSQAFLAFERRLKTHLFRAAINTTHLRVTQMCHGSVLTLTI